jgi:hypothetical protein
MLNYLEEGFYILVDKKTVPCTLWAWSNYFKKKDRVLQQTHVGKAMVSTVFLGINHRFGAGLPLLFETLVFDGPLDGEMERYTTWEEAMAGHEIMVSAVKAATGSLIKRIFLRLIRFLFGENMKTKAKKIWMP